MNLLYAGRLGVMLAAAILLGACGSETAPSPVTVPSLTASPALPAPTVSPVPTVSPAPTLVPTPAPTATPPASVSPTAVPSAEPTAGPDTAQSFTSEAEIGDVLFASDGRIVVFESDPNAGTSRVVTLDAYGRVVDGWPWSPAAGGDSFSIGALGPDGSVYAAVSSESGDPAASAWTLHRLDASARELPGFPVVLPDVPFCAVSVGTSGTAYVACEREDEDTGTVSGIISAVRPDGSIPAGWPVQFAGGAAIAGFRPDGALVVTLRKASSTSITVVREDGTRAPGWPRRVPGGAWTDSVFVDRQGRIHVTSRTFEEDQCGPATRTTYTVLQPDGDRVRGWPVSVRGWASDPLIADDGTTTIAVAAGRVVRYGRNGSVLAGWPARGVPVTAACYDGSMPVPAGKDGFVVSGEGRITLIKPAGRVASGWPVKPAYRPADACFGCTPGPGGPLDPAVGRKGVWVGAYRGGRPRVVGIARDGSMPDAWRQAVGERGDGIEWIRTAPTGRVWMLLGRHVDTGEDEGIGIGILVPVAEDLPINQ